MAIWHVWSGSGAEAANYTNWGTAAHSILTVDGLVSAGDTIYVAHDHSESNAGVTLTLVGGTLAAPIKVICGTRTGTDTETGISALATTAHITSTSSTSTINGAVPAYYYGIEFEGSYSGAALTMNVNSSSSSPNVMFEQCKFILSSTISTSSLRCGHESSADRQSITTFKDCQWRFGNAGQYFAPQGIVEIRGGSAYAGGTSPTSLFAPGAGGRGGLVTVTGFDFSGFSSSMDLVKTGNAGVTWRAIFRNCKMHASWSGTLLSTTPTTGSGYAELSNYGLGDTNYKFLTEGVYGTCSDEATIYRTAGAQDEATPYSIRMATTANVAWPGHCLRSPPIIKRVSSATGISKTLTVHIAHDGTIVTDQECWLEIEYLGTAGFPIALFDNDTTTIIGTPTSRTDGSEDWTGDTGTINSGGGTWVQTTVACSGFSFEETGYVIATVCLAKPSWTIFVDPKLTIT